MLDTLEIHIPMQSQFCYENGKLWSIVGEVAHYGLMGQGAIVFDIETKQLKPVGVQKHAYESLPSSYGGMAFKFFSHNVANTLPYVALKASAKFLEGHNIFGTENVQKLACEMIAKLKECYPVFYFFLDIDKARISRIDATYSARLADESMVAKTLDFLRNGALPRRVYLPLTDNNLPTNLWQFLIYQLDNPSLYQTLFKQKTDVFMQALQGMRMPYNDDSKVYELLMKRLADFTDTGNITTTKAKNAYNFYKLLKSDGFYEVKKRTPKSTFCRNIKLLCDAGFNRAFLQNLSGNTKETAVIRLLNVDLEARLPSSYVAPTTQYHQSFNQYLLNAVA